MTTRMKRMQRAERIEVIPIPDVGHAPPLSCYMAGIRPDEWEASRQRDIDEQERRAMERMHATILRELAKQAHRTTHTTEPL